MLPDRREDIEYVHKHQAEISGHMKYTSAIDKDGPEVLIISSIHGNEPAGTKAMIHFHRNLMANNSILKRGTIHFLLGNPAAYSQNKRYIEYDLNRSFVEGDNKTLEAARAKEIDSLLDRGGVKFAMVMDLHSLSKGTFQILVYNKNGLSGQLMAQEISPIMTHLAYTEDHIKGLLIDHCGKYGHPGIAIECGNHNDPNCEKVAFYHIYKLLLHYEMIGHRKQWDAKQMFINKHKQIIQYETIQAIIPDENFEFLRNDNITGTHFEKGEVFAKSGDKEFAAPEDCYIVMPPVNIDPDDYDAGFLCHKHILESL